MATNLYQVTNGPSRAMLFAALEGSFSGGGEPVRPSFTVERVGQITLKVTGLQYEQGRPQSLIVTGHQVYTAGAVVLTAGAVNFYYDAYTRKGGLYL